MVRQPSYTRGFFESYGESAHLTHGETVRLTHGETARLTHGETASFHVVRLSCGVSSSFIHRKE